MIVPQDLRISLWFIGYDNKPFQWLLNDFNALFSKVEIDEIIKSPIELNPSILKKIEGFEHIQGNFWGDSCFSIQLMIDSSETPVIVYILQVMDMNQFSKHSSVEIKYLHQLQNVYYFKTNGKELTITL